MRVFLAPAATTPRLGSPRLLFALLVSFLLALAATATATSLTADDNDDYKIINAHVPYYESIEAGTSVKVQVAIVESPQKDKGLSFIVAPTDASDPELEGLLDGDTATHKASYGYGADIIYFSPTEIAGKQFGQFTLLCPATAAAACSVGYLATFEQAVTLADGRSVYSYLSKGEVDYFTFTLPADVESAVLSFTQAKNYIDIYASATAHPTSETATWKSLHSNHRALTFTATDLGATRTVYVTVEGAATNAEEESEYSIVITAGATATTLRDAVPTEGKITGAADSVAAYYAFEAATDGCGLSVVVTPRSGAVPLLYINDPAAEAEKTPGTFKGLVVLTQKWRYIGGIIIFKTYFDFLNVIYGFISICIFSI